MAATDIGIDLGTASILVYVKGKGVVLKEPSVVAFDKDTNKIKAIGEEARMMMTAHAVAMVIWPIAFTLPNALRASLDAKFTMLVSVSSMWIFRVGLAYCFVMAMNMGIMGVWYGMFVDWIFRAILFGFRFKGYGKRKMRQLA